ncbi:hypothetical protein JCM1840_001755 [Sporobolomyces johnsonii]
MTSGTTPAQETTGSTATEDQLAEAFYAIPIFDGKNPIPTTFDETGEIVRRVVKTVRPKVGDATAAGVARQTVMLGLGAMLKDSPATSAKWWSSQLAGLFSLRSRGGYSSPRLRSGRPRRTCVGSGSNRGETIGGPRIGRNVGGGRRGRVRLRRGLSDGRHVADSG